jgi:hypothetical protein
MAKGKKQTQDALVFRFKVALADYRYEDEKGRKKKPYRIIDVLENQTFEEFHEYIYMAFDRDDEHLYMFQMSMRRWNNNDIQINAPQCEEFDDEMSFNAETTPINYFSLTKGSKFLYVFDFGDEWWHEITVVDIFPQTEKNFHYPQIVESVGESPPQYPEWEEEEDG